MFRFRTSPIEIKGDGKVESIVLGRNELVADDTGRVSAKDTGEREEVPAQLVVRAVGYRGVATPGLPFDDKNGTIPHSSGRVEGSRNEYVVGWIKRGPTGVIGSNKKRLAGDRRHPGRRLGWCGPGRFRREPFRGAGGMVCRAAAEGRHRRPLEAHRRPRAWRRWHRGQAAGEVDQCRRTAANRARLTPDSHVRTLHRISSPRGRPLQGCDAQTGPLGHAPWSTTT